MKKRMGVLLAIIFILSICFSYGAAVHEAYHHSGDTFKIGDDIYTVRSNPPYFSVLRLDVNGELFIIQQNDSFRTTFYQYEFNMTNKSWDDPYLTIDEYGRIQPGLFLKIYFLAPAITITRTAQKTTLALNEKTQITVKITNTGSEMAEAVIYTEELPENITLIDKQEGVNQIGNKIYWNGILYEGKEKSFSYSIKQTKYGTSKLKANVSYYYEGLQKFQTAPDVAITVPTPYYYSTALSTPININGFSTFTMKIKNNEPENNLKFRIEHMVSPDLKILTTTNSLKNLDENSYWDYGYLEPGAEKDYEIRMTTPYSGDYDIKSNFYFEVNNLNFSLNETKNLVVKNPTINSVIYLNRQNIRAGETFIARVEFANNDPIRSFYDLKFTLSSDFFNEIISIDRLDPGREYIQEKEITTPEYENPKTYTINLNGVFKTEGGETLTSSTKKSLTAGPANQTVSLTQTISNKILKPNGNYTVEVKVRNEKDDPVSNIQVFDEYPNDIILLQGDTSKILPGLVGKQEKTLYMYKAIIPQYFEYNNFSVITHLNYTKAGITYSKNIVTIMRVENLIPKNIANISGNITHQINQSQNINTTNRKSSGFFSNVVSDVKSFFKSVLGI